MTQLLHGGVPRFRGGVGIELQVNPVASCHGSQPRKCGLPDRGVVGLETIEQERPVVPQFCGFR